MLAKKDHSHYVHTLFELGETDMFHTTASAWSISPQWQKIVVEQLNGRNWKQWLLDTARAFVREQGDTNLPFTAAATLTCLGLAALIPDQLRLLLISYSLIGFGIAGLIWHVCGDSITRLATQGFRMLQAQGIGETVKAAYHAIARKYADILGQA